MPKLVSFLMRLSEISHFSFIIIDNQTDQVIVEKNVTTQWLSMGKWKYPLASSDIVSNFFDQEQNLLFFHYQLIKEKKSIILYIDDKASNFVSYNHQLLKIAEMIHLFVTGKEFTKKDIQLINQNILYLKESVIEDVLSEQKEQHFYHHDFESEERLFSVIEIGDEERLKQQFFLFNQNITFGKLSSKSELRNKKNLLIATVAISTRYAIKGGVPQERAYTLSDLLIQKIDKKNSFQESEFPELEVMLLFCQEVSKFKHLNYSIEIKKVCNFIERNIYSELSLPIIASATNYSIPHLSKKFKAETQMTINQYVVKQKIEESKRLLEMTHSDLTTISSLLHFADVSYFIKVFKKFENMTPREYQKMKNIR